SIAMQQEMTQLVGSGENPPFHRDPVPGIDAYRGATIVGSDREAEESVACDPDREYLDAAGLQEPADVTDRLPRPDLELATNVRSEIHAPAGAAPLRRHRL